MKNQSVLVVDDSASVRFMLVKILKAKGFEVQTAETGLKGFNKFNKNQDFDVIIVDINMPEMDGLQFIKELRIINTSVPIIVLSGNSEVKIVIDAIRSGANDYITKDGNMQEMVLIAIKKILKESELKKHNVQLMADLAQKNIELEKFNNKLVELSDIKNKFIGIAAHDLRNPLGVIKGFSEILHDELKGNVSEDELKYVKIIESASNEMLNLVNDLLDVSLIESGNLEIEKKADCISDLVNERIQMNLFKAHEKKMKIDFKIQQGMDDVKAKYDSNRISQVIDNYFTNAIKYSPQGSTIYINIENQDNMICVSIKDEGPGISQKDQSRLFGEFQKLSAKPTGGEKSIGLGLAIVKKIILAHDGLLGVNSELGSGSTFYFKLPIN